jgi:hypothetical protein
MKNRYRGSFQLLLPVLAIRSRAQSHAVLLLGGASRATQSEASWCNLVQQPRQDLAQLAFGALQPSRGRSRAESGQRPTKNSSRSEAVRGPGGLPRGPGQRAGKWGYRGDYPPHYTTGLPRSFHRPAPHRFSPHGGAAERKAAKVRQGQLAKRGSRGRSACRGGQGSAQASGVPWGLTDHWQPE